MASYIIIYEHEVGLDKAAALFEAVKKASQWGRISTHSWVIKSEGETAVAIRDRLMALINSGDRLMVVKSGTEAAWVNSLANSDWLKQNL